MATITYPADVTDTEWRFVAPLAPASSEALVYLACIRLLLVRLA